uniref:Secreted protein n=1 Tax=Knipowitschia caucasica TaxID=637954 RepID=A0AAV2L4V2_KNICA
MWTGCGHGVLFTVALIAPCARGKDPHRKVVKMGTSDATGSLSSASPHLHQHHISWSKVVRSCEHLAPLLCFLRIFLALGLMGLRIM